MKLNYLPLAVLAALLIAAPHLFAGHSLTEAERAVVDSWLKKHPQYRAATDSDCDCATDIRTIREQGYGGKWKAVRDYHPYMATGDFNGDGVEDFAIAVVDRSRKAQKFALLVFNGPFDSSDVAPAYLESKVDLRATGMFFGPPRPKPYRLVIGPFESEGYILIPRGKTYRLKDVSTVGE